MYKYFYFVFLLLFVSCDNTPDEKDKPEPKPVVKTEFEPVEVLFDEDNFQDTSVVGLLKEINICSPSMQDSLGLAVPDCSPKYFKLFPLKEGGSLYEGFILLTKANTGGIALRRLLVFERERGNLVKVNGFIANLIGTRPSSSKYDDLMIRFKDNIEGSDVYYNCLFQWEQGKYQFKSVETIHEPAAEWVGTVRADVKDSVSKEILEIIQGNEMIF